MVEEKTGWVFLLVVKVVKPLVRLVTTLCWAVMLEHLLVVVTVMTGSKAAKVVLMRHLLMMEKP